MVRNSHSSSITTHLNRSKNTGTDDHLKKVLNSAAIEHPKPQSVMSSVNNSTAVEVKFLKH